MYVSIDVETTGLDPECCQILEIGAVAFTHTDINQCQTFELVINPEKGPVTGLYGNKIVGEAYALAMNFEILDLLSTGHGVSSVQATDYFAQWLARFALNGETKGFINAVGCNFGSFDWQFLNKLPYFPKTMFNYRMVDVGSRFAGPGGPVSMTKKFAQIAEKHNIQGKPHRALFDAKCTLAAFTDSLVEAPVNG